jgi:hypothetical protein
MRFLVVYMRRQSSPGEESLRLSARAFSSSSILAVLLPRHQVQAY